MTRTATMPLMRLVADVEVPPAASVTWENTGMALLGEPVMKLMTMARTGYFRWRAVSMSV